MLSIKGTQKIWKRFPLNRNLPSMECNEKEEKKIPLNWSISRTARMKRNENEKQKCAAF